MPAHRYFLDSPLTEETATLAGDEFHHVKNVMRARTGDTIEIVNGQGILAHARLLEIKNTSALFKITQRIHQPPPATSIILAQALTRPALLDWIVEKGTELGATHFWLFPGDQSEKKELTPHQLDRLRTLITSALKQCGRLYLPTLELKPPLSKWQQPSGTVLFGSLASNSKPLSAGYSSPVIMVIGPEKGFSDQEHTILETKLHGTAVTLHPNILRTETAALCALSLLSQQLKY
ncbi:MAG: RsmE family RNA methyltransferase [Rhabdochlamydiaceae bacterium]|jgi:16S rRNA (uracil1498-N3)-methyltransferase